MTILAFEGFDTYASKTSTVIGMASRWTVGGNTNGAMVTGRYAGQALEYQNPTSTSVKDQLNLGNSYSALAFGIAIRASDVPGDWGAAGTGEPMFSLYDSANALQVDFTLDLKPYPGR